MKFKWVIDHESDENAVDHLAKELGIPRILSRILLQRGIDCFDKARTYFRPEVEELHDPFLMKDMDKAVDRLHQALEKGEKILVYGDYDVDGVSGCSLLYLILSRMVGSRVTYYIPDRITEGYGLSRQAIQEHAEKGVTLILAIDCGVTAVDEIRFARELGVDVLVCDHHEPGDELPPAAAILDPKRPDCPYPFKELAGVGVGFKLMQALYRRLGLVEAELDEYLDIVAIGSCADIVPLIDENRILVRHGLDRINSNPRFGIKALLESSGIDRKEITVGLVVFVLAPRINAVGRMGDARRAVQLFTSQSLQQARTLAKELEKENKVRRDVDETTFKEALEIIESQFDAANDYAFVLYKRDWHPGVIGIAASRIVERFYRPTIMISVVDGIGKGSARSIANFNVYEAIKQCSQHLITFGGHKYAAGLTIREENIPSFIEMFKEVARAQITPEDLVPTMKIDCEVHLNDFDERLMRLLKLMGPFGPLNLRPVFVSRKLKVVGEPSIVGSNHLKLNLEQNGVTMTAIGFNFADQAEEVLKNNRVIDCAYVLEENYWNGRKELQMRLKDIK
ncbi:MAG: single-stranded-DNA-specific exonuclease RecJ [Calditrichaceae bacterium]|nr:single-stranded-DNA-specific exonuclease RecJ [Calditrichia bacterium]NUQ41631.1 single-stranded-DNA-specific exonuclease RecJ [Calditrichaceae bacterium]